MGKVTKITQVLGLADSISKRKVIMKKLIYYVATTVDHYIGHEDGSADGFLPEGDHIQGFFDSLANFDSVLMGRKTYEYGFDFGLEMGQPAYAPFNLKNYIFSRTMHFDSTDQVQLVNSDEVAFVRNLKQNGVDNGKHIWLGGGGAFAGTLLENELINELILKVHPIIFGGGIPLFGPSTKNVDLKLYDTHLFSSGVIVLSYQIQYHKP
jgi:dihydrofolate reductase